MPRASVRLFVYGSLKRGGRHHEELAGARFLGLAETEPGYRLEQLGEYLALTPPTPNQPDATTATTATTAPTAPTCGELFEIDESLLPTLDAFEGDAYYRAEITVSLVLGRAGNEARTQTRLDSRDCVFALAYLKKAR